MLPKLMLKNLVHIKLTSGYFMATVGRCLVANSCTIKECGGCHETG